MEAAEIFRRYHGRLQTDRVRVIGGNFCGSVWDWSDLLRVRAEVVRGVCES